ncbi:MAG TPA: cytochrome C oxidase subunit IV family protein [Anaerolineaceae bacterium]|nr:cytochrome C oxidase subunit IV family protein [Anaerolineaceae bacterium]
MIKDAPAPKKARSNYVTVLILLVVFTIIEVTVSYIAGGIKVPVLLTLAGIKAALVVLYFMHLRRDSRLYAIMFLIGAFLIIPLLLIMTLVMPGL